MRIHRFYWPQPIGQKRKVTIENETLVHQWRSVLRFQVGHEVVLFDNTGLEYKAHILSMTNRKVEVEIYSSRRGETVPRLPLFLFLSLAKRDSFEWTLEKVTEIGVSGIIPVISERSEKKTINLERSREILKEASEQSGRTILPEIYEPLSLEKAVENLAGLSCAFDPGGESFSTGVSEKFKAGERVSVFIGPEGGFSKKEIDLFKEKKIPVYSLGKNILRTETAAVAITANLLTA